MLVIAKSDGLLSERLAEELAEVEARFAEELVSDLECVNELIAHVERYRGKMLRPTLVLLTAMAGDPKHGRARQAHRILATVIEMVHMATLVHDDILDEGRLRRRGTTINHLAGNEAAVMLGDYLISHAYHLCAALNNERISRMIANATNTVCEGELLQLANRNNWQLGESVYFEIIRRKTASLCGISCQTSAIVSGACERTAGAMQLYGEKLGLAFQIVDDLLDLTGDEQTVGKTLGRDLEKGKLTLPMIHALNHAPASVRTQLKELLIALGRRGGDGVSPISAVDVQQVRELLAGVGSVSYAQQWAERLVASARSAVREHLPHSPARSLMLDMAEAVLNRRF